MTRILTDEGIDRIICHALDEEGPRVGVMS
jgi:hypothetical protein